MKNKMAVGIIAVVVILGVIFIFKPFASKTSAKKGSPPVEAKVVKGKLPAPVKKTFSKDMGGLTVKALNTKNKEVSLKGRAFKSIDSKSSIFFAAFASGKMVELTPGTYDIELDTIPQKIFKNINVSKGKETIADLGNVSGLLDIKALNSKKKNAANPVRIFYAGSNIVVATTVTNKPIDLAASAYDIEVGTLPPQPKKEIKVENGKDTVVDLGCAVGGLIVKTMDENGKDVRCTVKIKRSQDNALVSSVQTNRLTDLVPGTYNLEIVSNPVQNKEGVTIDAGVEQVIEFTIQTSAQAPAPVKAALPLPAAPKVPVKR